MKMTNSVSVIDLLLLKFVVLYLHAANCITSSLIEFSLSSKYGQFTLCADAYTYEYTVLGI